jgi:predicted metal-dependent HD superfamily phosphohydrolase
MPPNLSTALEPPEPLPARWAQLGQRLGIDSPAWHNEGDKLLRHWARWPRAYHNTQHLRACLYHLDALNQASSDAMAQPDTVALALWFHDAIYWPWKSNNEERSAQWAQRFLTAQNLPESQVQAVAQHILATRHQPGPLQGDARWVVDIDLAILGQSEAVYRQFERDVRREYRFVPWARYVAGRSAVLRSFLVREHLYETGHFAQRFEHQARKNLAMALKTLTHNAAF